MRICGFLGLTVGFDKHRLNEQWRECISLKEGPRTSERQLAGVNSSAVHVLTTARGRQASITWLYYITAVSVDIVAALVVKAT